jgi:LmbE family N-acetylglucosaminyl deacetylase
MGRSILLLLAHPDDESFLAGGIVSKYVDQGVHVALVTATRGESGKVGEPPVCTREELPAVREAELREAAAILGIRDLTLLGYRDRELALAPVPEVRRALIGIIRRCRPDVVITFDPNGSNLHPDHIAISRFTSDAVTAAVDPRWHQEEGEAFRVPRLLWTPPARPWELASDQEVRARPGVDFVIDIRPWAERKLRAVGAHRTQMLSGNRVFFNHPDRERRLSAEVFRQAWGPPLAERPLGDLFAGLPDEDRTR